MEIIIICAVSRNDVIGINNSIPWKIADDMKIFREKTLHHTVLMGRKTYESIGRPLPQRTNIVISKNKIDNITCFSDISDAITHVKNSGETKLFIIGGGQIYSATLPLATHIYYTLVDTIITSPNATTFNFHPWEKTESLTSVANTSLLSPEWDNTYTFYGEKNKKNQYDFTYMEFARSNL